MLSILLSWRLPARHFGLTAAGNMLLSSPALHDCPLPLVGGDNGRNVFIALHRRPLPLASGDDGRLVPSTYRHCRSSPLSGGVQGDVSLPLPQHHTVFGGAACDNPEQLKGCTPYRLCQWLLVGSSACISSSFKPLTCLSTSAIVLLSRSSCIMALHNAFSVDPITLKFYNDPQ